ncbi:hypothetical protein [Phyllobacterium sp. CL33Tsu]|uniref:hypothetical protein n=1 Tax=Phyllobacterium sp. CL33Tsu TaxID=1798191 RepID=UPI001113FEC6|nr:hypothetical protein [Phyllobacterium sp. CL33Tsu]
MTNSLKHLAFKIPAIARLRHQRNTALVENAQLRAEISEIKHMLLHQNERRNGRFVLEFDYPYFPRVGTHGSR